MVKNSGLDIKRCGGEERIGAKEHEGAFWSDRNVQYIDHNPGYTSTYTCKNSMNYMFKMGTLYKLHLKKSCFKKKNYTFKILILPILTL